MEQEWTVVITIEETDPAQAWNVNALSDPLHLTAAVEGRRDGHQDGPGKGCGGG